MMDDGMDGWVGVAAALWEGFRASLPCGEWVETPGERLFDAGWSFLSSNPVILLLHFERVISFTSDLDTSQAISWETSPVFDSFVWRV